MHVELLEHKRKMEEAKTVRKPFVYKETDFPSISERKRSVTGKLLY